MTGVVNTTGARSGAVGTNVGTPAHTETNAANVGSGVLPVGVTGGSGLDKIQLVRNGVLFVEYASGSTVDIDADILTLFDSSNVGVILGVAGVASSINLTMNQDNDSAGGGSNGVLGLDTGSFGNSTWYHLYVIYNGTTTSCVASLAQNWISTTNDGTAGTTKGVDKSNIAGYTFGKYVGAVYSDSGGTFLDFRQKGNDVIRGMIAFSSTIFTTSWVTRDLTAFVPSTATKVRGQIRGVNTGISVNISAAAYGSGTGEDGMDQQICYIYLSDDSQSSLQTAGVFNVRILTPQTIYVKTIYSINSNEILVGGWSFDNIV